MASDAYIDQFDGDKYAHSQMLYLIKKGQDMQASMDTHAKTKIYCHLWPGQSRRTTWDLLACNTDEAPQRSTHKVRD
jgi:hypothetical protein